MTDPIESTTPRSRSPIHEVYKRDSSPTPRIDDLMRRSNLSLSNLSVSTSELQKTHCPKHSHNITSSRDNSQKSSKSKSCLKSVSPRQQKGKKITFQSIDEFTDSGLESKYML